MELWWEVKLHLRSQTLVDLLHQPGEGASIHSLGQGIASRNHLLKVTWADRLQHMFIDFKLETTKNTRNKAKTSNTSSPFAVNLLWVSASPRAEPSTPSSWKTTIHLFSAAPPHKILCIFEHPVILVWLFWPSKDCLSAAQWWYKFLLPPLLQTECFPGGEHWRWYSAAPMGHTQEKQQPQRLMFLNKSMVRQNVGINTQSEPGRFYFLS